MAERPTFWFDFVSPYAWLAWMRLRQLRHDGEMVRLTLRPVVYAKLLEAVGASGPAEVPARRVHFVQDVVRSAARAGVPLEGPPVHPFRSIEALRCACLFLEDPRVDDQQRFGLCAGLADAAWGRGLDLTDVSTIAAVVDEHGLGALVAGDGPLAERLAAALSRSDVKAKLVGNTSAAIAEGVFGVPTFRLGAQTFWGHDRLDDLLHELRADATGEGSRFDESKVAQMLERPAGVVRTARVGMVPEAR